MGVCRVLGSGGRLSGFRLSDGVDCLGVRAMFRGSGYVIPEA